MAIRSFQRVLGFICLLLLFGGAGSNGSSWAASGSGTIGYSESTRRTVPRDLDYGASTFDGTNFIIRGQTVSQPASLDADGKLVSISPAAMRALLSVPSSAEAAAAYQPIGSYQAANTYLAQLAAFSDPDVDVIWFWDNSAGSWAALVIGTGLEISGTTLVISQQNSAYWLSKVSDATGTGAMLFQHGNIGSGTAAQPSAGDNSARIPTTAWVLAERGSTLQAYSAALQQISGISAVQGDVLYYNGSTWARLAKGTALQYLRMNSGATAPEWATLSSSGSGDVTGPSSATNNNLVAFDTTTGKAIKDSKIKTDGNGNIETAGEVAAASFRGTGAVASSRVDVPDDDASHYAGFQANDTTTTSVNMVFPAAPFSGIAKWTASGTNWVPSQATADSDYSTPTGSSALQNKDLTHTSNILPAEIGFTASSDETTALTTGTGKRTFRMPFAMTVTAVRASLATAQTSGSIFTVDINEGGTSILSTKLTIDNAEKTSTTAATAAVISDTALADDAEITVDIDQVGDGTAKGLKLWIIGTR